jgi:subtilisin family serine protease
MKNLLQQSAMISATVVLAATTASAGTLIKLNSGVINPAQIQSQYSMTMDQRASDYIVQFKTPVKEADKAALVKAGFQVLGYLPDDALVVRASAGALEQFQAAHAKVNAFIAYAGTYKVSSEFEAGSVFNKDVVSSVVVHTFKASETENIANRIQALNPNAQIQSVGGKDIMVLMPRSMVNQVAVMTGVEHIQPTPQFESFHFALDQDSQTVGTATAGDYTDLSGMETGTRVMKFDAAWAAGFTGRNQIVSMADTGLDTGNTATALSDFGGAIYSGYPFGLFSKSWEDPMGHGTHVAGSVLGRGTNSKGLLKGGAYEAKMVAESMWSPMLKNLSVPNKLGDLFAKAYGDGARVHTNSWGAVKGAGAYDTYAMQVDEFMFNNPEMLVLFAAGNSGADLDKDGRIDGNTMATPGTSKNVLTVGASENRVSTGGIQVPISKLRAAKDEWPAEPIYSSYISDNENGMAMFSSRGPTADGRTKPDVVAPGTNILSTKSQVPGASDLWGSYNPFYAWSGGTSMATPLTAGAVAVARQIVQEKWNIQNPSGALMKAVMVHTATDMYPGQYGEVGAAKGQELLTRRPNSDEGYGRVNMENILNVGSATKVIDERTGVAQGAETSYDVVVGQGGSLYANLVWTDAPGSANAAQALVNDLDLVLTTPGGQTLSMNDHINNLEAIEKSGLTAGNYKLTVKGYRVPQGKNGAQPYALIFTAR